MPPVSIIIPVFNQWDLTRACLRSIRATVPDGVAEVILVDNASTDLTPKGAPFLGKELFGNNFSYLRNRENRNFAGASNQGAAAASGEFILFLNNDTELLPGWLEPLLSDFREYPDLAATGPVLLYPEKPLIGHTVQHLGVSISPFRKIGHLYEGISAASPLTKKRRFFQIITAACMMMPGAIFQKAGGFDEGYKNGFEDVDLCARLSASGYRFTVNPEARIIHYQGQSAGRTSAEAENSTRMKEKVLHLLRPDKAGLFAADGMEAGLNDWQIEVPLLKPHIQETLASKAAAMDQAELLAALIENPFWTSGWKRLLAELPPEEMEKLTETVHKLVREPCEPVAACRAALAMGNRKKAEYWFNTASVFCLPESVYLDSARSQAALAFSIGEPEAGKAYEAWIAESPEFFKNRLHPFIADFGRLARELGVAPGGNCPWAFALDYDLNRKNRRENTPG